MYIYPDKLERLEYEFDDHYFNLLGWYEKKIKEGDKEEELCAREMMVRQLGYLIESVMTEEQSTKYADALKQIDQCADEIDKEV